jgi:GTPase-associated system helical domain
MIATLPEWYRILSIQNLTTEIFETRSISIKKILKTKDIGWFFNCIRLFVGKQISDQNFLGEMTRIFLEEDPLFKQKDNLLELRVLAGAVVNEIIETPKHKDKISTAIALKCSLFGINTKDLINTEIITLANNFLAEESLRLREFDDKRTLINLSIESSVPDTNPATLAAIFTKINEQLHKVSISINEKSDYNSRRIQVLEEESNIHWWIFRYFSNVLNKPMRDVEFELAPIIVGKELNNLILILPWPKAFEEYLKKVIYDSFPSENNKEILFKDSINALKRLKIDLFATDHASLIGNICPLLTAYSLSNQSGDETGWFSFFEKSTDIKHTIKVSCIELAKQSFFESMLLKSLN